MESNAVQTIARRKGLSADPGNGPVQRSDALFFAVPVLLAFVLRAAVASIGLPWETSDTQIYWWMADQILAGEPVSYAPNGYPLLLVALRSLVPAEAVVASGLALNVLLSTATVALAYAMARTLGSAATASAAATVLAVYPNQLNYTRLLLTEVPSTFFLLLALFWFHRAAAASLPGRAAASGLALGASLLFRTALMPLVLILAGIGWRTGTLRSRVVPLVLGLLVIAGAHGLAGSAGLVKPSSNLNMNLLIAIDERVDGQIDWDNTRFTEAEKANPLPVYVSFAFEHPARFAAQRAKSLWDLWGPWPGSGDEARPRSVSRRLLIGLRFPLLLLGLVGLVLHRREPAAWLLVAPAIVVTAVHVPFFSEPRFTFVAEPGLVVLAVLALAAAGNRAWRSRATTAA